MADKKQTSSEKANEKFITLENDRHNDNARASAAPQTNTPRIRTDNL
ncbi:hypothetical protein [Neobacillus sp. DY30]|nr:hypothetical protein [Neobacillus sp. DY30]WHY00276.1 hypothetical protein QNH29_27750 [Neobacillus sp. DY30]